MATTTLNCLEWMQNQNEQSPCATAVDVGQLCYAGYDVSLNNFQESDYIPNGTTANECTCCWSIYNLLSACSYCVGQYNYTSWGMWVSNCGNYISSTSYLPSGLKLTQGIPFWATTNPSTWENAVFNVTRAADIAAAAHPDVTGGPLPTSTSTAVASATSGGATGAIIGSVIGAIAILIIGGLVILWAARRHRRSATPSDASSFNASQPATVPVPMSHSRSSARSVFGYASISSHRHPTSPVHSTTSLAATSQLGSPISSGLSSHRRSTSQPLSDAADMISPFLTMSPARAANGPNPLLPTAATGKAAEERAERTRARATSPGRRVRLNPPPYSASVEAEPSGSSSPVAAVTRRWSSMRKQRRRDGSVSGATTCSGHSRTSTRESATVIHAGSRTETSRQPGTGTVANAVSTGRVSGDNPRGDVETTQNESAKPRPPLV